MHTIREDPGAGGRTAMGWGGVAGGGPAVTWPVRIFYFLYRNLDNLAFNYIRLSHYQLPILLSFSLEKGSPGPAHTGFSMIRTGIDEDALPGFTGVLRRRLYSSDP